MLRGACGAWVEGLGLDGIAAMLRSLSLGLSRKVRVFAYGAPIDMRKSFNTFSALVLELGHEVTTGDAFVFVGKGRRRTKVLWFDRTGLCLLAKRLEPECMKLQHVTVMCHRRTCQILLTG